MPYRFLDHTADAKFEAKADSVEELFEQCAYALVEIMTDERIHPRKSHKISIQAPKVETLLYDFLNELVFLAENKKFIWRSVRVTIDGNKATAELKGDDITKYDVTTYIKAVTHHGMIVDSDKYGWRAEIVVDL